MKTFNGTFPDKYGWYWYFVPDGVVLFACVDGSYDYSREGVRFDMDWADIMTPGDDEFEQPSVRRLMDFEVPNNAVFVGPVEIPEEMMVVVREWSEKRAAETQEAREAHRRATETPFTMRFTKAEE